MIPTLLKNGRMMVIDDNYEGVPGTTTTLEGIKNVLTKLLTEKIYYDAIIIDYYQNVKSSKHNPFLNEYQVQEQLAAFLDQYKNSYPAPIVLLAQVDPVTEENKKPFEHRIKGRKVISDKATFTMEIVADRENLRTEWCAHKGRFAGLVGRSFYTGFDRGKFVAYDENFMKAVAAYKEKQMEKQQLGQVFKEKEDGNKDKPSGSDKT